MPQVLVRVLVLLVRLVTILLPVHPLAQNVQLDIIQLRDRVVARFVQRGHIVRREPVLVPAARLVITLHRQDLPLVPFVQSEHIVY